MSNYESAADLLLEHLKLSRRSTCSLHLGTEEQRSMHLVGSLLNATAALFLSSLIEVDPALADSLVARIDDGDLTGEGLSVWVNRQLMARGVDMAELIADLQPGAQS